MAQQKSGHVTLLDIARACGFSVSTVSIVLSEAPLSRNVAAKTRDRIRAMALKLGYHPDAFARSLRSRSSQTIGVLAYDLSDPFCIPVVQGIQTGLYRARYLPLLIDAQSQRRLFDNYMKMILERRAESLIVIASWVFEETNILADLKKNHVPIVIIGRDLTGRGIDSVLVDNEAGGALAMRHLTELGHRNVAVIRGPEEMFDSDPRWAGIQCAAEAAGIKLNPKLVFQLPGLVDPTSGFEGGIRIANEMLASGRSFTAVVAFDDLTALGVIRGLANAGVCVPRDCSVVGFDGILPAEVATPPITTIRQPLKEMGIRSAEWVMRAIGKRGRGTDDASLLFKARPELIVRSSTGPPPARRQKVSSRNGIET
ncbi:MAG TPA: LacI family DNA-binding transcriptional regulator [Terracidiphilus sp.]|nr:LacI family DNA-binding transcriptional regulator [Terracidiphilus sp.]